MISITFLDADGSALFLQLLGQKGACPHARKVFGTVDFEDVAVNARNDIAFTALRNLEGYLHKRKAEFENAILPA